MFQAWLVKMAKIAASSGPSTLPGKQRDEEHDGEGQIAEDRHRLQHVEQRDQHHFGAPALGGEGRVGEGEDQRRDQRDHHPRRRTQRIQRQRRRRERNHRRAGCDPWRNQLVSGGADQREDRHHQDEGSRVAPVRQPLPPNAADQHVRMMFQDESPRGRKFPGRDAMCEYAIGLAAPRHPRSAGDSIPGGLRILPMDRRAFARMLAV